MEYQGYKTFMVRGNPRFQKYGKLVKKNTLPRDVMEHFGLLSPGEPEETDTPDEPRKDPKACLFCGMHSRFTRYVNAQTVFVCDEHYYSENIGKVAQKLRELRDEEENRKEISQESSNANEGQDAHEENADERTLEHAQGTN